MKIPAKLDPIEITEMLNHHSLSEIAAYYDVSLATVYNFCKENNISVQPNQIR